MTNVNEVPSSIALESARRIQLLRGAPDDVRAWTNNILNSLSASDHEWVVARVKHLRGLNAING